MRSISSFVSGRIVPALNIAAGTAAAEAVIATLGASSALAQQVTNGGGADAPFAPGVTTGLNWVFFLGAAVAVFSFLGGCFLLYLRNPMGAGAAFVLTVIGAAFMANANAILTTLTGLGFA